MVRRKYSDTPHPLSQPTLPYPLPKKLIPEPCSWEVHLDVLSTSPVSPAVQPISFSTLSIRKWASLMAQSVVENPPAMQEMRLDPWVGKSPWRRKWQPTPVFLPGESHGQRNWRLPFMRSQRVGHDRAHM